MSRVFPTASWDQDYVAATVPFQLRAVYATPSFRRLLLDADGTLQGWVNMDAEGAAHGRLLYAYDAILRAHYGMTLDVDYPLILVRARPGVRARAALPHPVRHALPRGAGAPPAPAARRGDARADPAAAPPSTSSSPSGCLPDAFEFSGFVVVRATDVTDQEVLSAIERDLIDKESIVSTERFQELEDKLRTLLRRPALRLGLAAFQDGRVFVLNYSCDIEHGCIFADTEHLRMSDFVGSVHERAVTQGRPRHRRRPLARAAADRVRGRDRRPGRAQRPGGAAPLPGSRRSAPSS